MENLNEQKQNSKAKKCTNLTLKIISYIICIFFILSGLIYFSQIPASSILLIIAGIFIIPPVSNNLIKNKQYKLIKNIAVFIIFMVFVLNVPTEENKKINNTQEANAQNVVQENNTESNTQNQIAEDNSNNVVQSTPTFSTGKYLGAFREDKRSGTGEFTWNDGTIYNGSWYEDKLSGKGKMTFSNKEEYEGDFKDNKRNGTGKYIFKNGDVYEGAFKNDSMEGEGKYTFKNGDVYEGTFKDNKFNGTGTYTKNGKKYTGTWTNNKYSK